MDLTTEEGVVSLMRSSQSEEEWNANCGNVQAANGGYPPFWYPAIVASGLASEVSAVWRGDAEIHIEIHITTP